MRQSEDQVLSRHHNDHGHVHVHVHHIHTWHAPCVGVGEDSQLRAWRMHSKKFDFDDEHVVTVGHPCVLMQLMNAVVCCFHR